MWFLFWFSPVLTWQQLDVCSVVKANCAGILLHTQSLHRLKLHRPRENLTLLITQLTHIIERLELRLWRISVRSPAEIKLTLLEWHEARSRKEARTEWKLIIKRMFFSFHLYHVVLWKTWLNDWSFCPLREKTRNLLSMSMKHPTMSPACHWGTESWGSQSALNHMSCLQPSYAWLQSSSPIPYLQILSTWYTRNI